MPTILALSSVPPARQCFIRCGRQGDTDFRVRAAEELNPRLGADKDHSHSGAGIHSGHAKPRL